MKEDLIVCFMALTIYFLYASASDDNEFAHIHIPNANGTGSLHNLIEALDLAQYNTGKFDYYVHDVLDLGHFDFDRAQGRSLGDMLSYWIDIIRRIQLSPKGMSEQEAKALIMQAINGRLCNLENRMNKLERDNSYLRHNNTK